MPSPSPQRDRPSRLPSLLGESLPVRIRSTVLAMLGACAAVGLTMVGLMLTQDWPLAPDLPIPALPKGEVKEAEVVSTGSAPDDRIGGGLEPTAAARSGRVLAAAGPASRPPARSRRSGSRRGTAPAQPPGRARPVAAAPGPGARGTPPSPASSPDAPVAATPAPAAPQTGSPAGTPPVTAAVSNPGRDGAGGADRGRNRRSGGVRRRVASGAPGDGARGTRGKPAKAPRPRSASGPSQRSAAGAPSPGAGGPKASGPPEVAGPRRPPRRRGPTGRNAGPPPPGPPAGERRPPGPPAGDGRSPGPRHAPGGRGPNGKRR